MSSRSGHMIPWSSTRPGKGSCPWVGEMPSISTGWGGKGWRAAQGEGLGVMGYEKLDMKK